MSSAGKETAAKSGWELAAFGNERLLRHPMVIAMLWLAFASGCAFVESAAEVTVGDGFLPRFSFDTAFPSVEELGSFSLEDIQDLPGFPPDLSGATLAHVQGALTLRGDCRAELDRVEQQEDDRVSGMRSFTLTSCHGAGRCRDICPDPGDGMHFFAAIDLMLIDEEQTDEIVDLLSEVSAEAIVQMRLRFFQLTLCQGEGDALSCGTEMLERLSLRVRNEYSDEVIVVPEGYLDRISAATPQRFDLDGESKLMQRIERRILAGQPISLTLVTEAMIPQPYLYELKVEGTFIRVNMQPEVVVDVLEAAMGKLR